MSNCNLNALDPMKFTQLLPMRKEEVAAAPADPLRTTPSTPWPGPCTPSGSF